MTEPPDELKIYELSLIWREAEYNFAFWERLAGSLDWDKAYREALPAVLKTKNTYEYYMELKKFVSLLRDGHTGVWFPKEIDNSPEYTSKLPIRTQLIGGERVITKSNNNLPNEFYANFPLLEKARGCIIDVRNNGGGFQICTRLCTYPDGREFINIGVKPHIPCEMTLDDYKNGVDSVMNKGLEELRKQISG